MKEKQDMKKNDNESLWESLLRLHVKIDGVVAFNNRVYAKVEAIAATLEMFKAQSKPYNYQQTVSFLKKDFIAPDPQPILGREKVGGPQLEECSTCKFFKKTEFEYDPIDSGKCRLNPKYAKRYLGDWCGQHKRGYHE